MRCFAFAIFFSFYSFLGFATTWYSKTGEVDLTILSSWTEFPNGTGMFSELDFKGKDVLEKDENQKGISFLNRYYIFQKHTNAMKSRKVYEDKHLLKVKIN